MDYSIQTRLYGNSDLEFEFRLHRFGSALGRPDRIENKLNVKKLAPVIIGTNKKLAVIHEQ